MIELLGTFFIISLSGALSPGPLTTVAIAEGSRRGKWSGWWLSLGHGLAEGIYVAVIALILWLGRDSLLQQPLVAGIIALVGGGFLVWMGWSLAVAAWRHQLTLTGEAAKEARFGLVPTGVFFSLSNPYWWVWWALITPLYIRQSLAWGLVGVALLFVVHWSTDVGWLTGLAWLTGSGHSLVSPGVYRWVMLACGVLLLLFGVSFVVAGLGFLYTGEVGLASKWGKYFMTDTVTLTIDGHTVTVPKGTTILNAAASVGINIPTICYHPALTPPAVCRLCTVEVEKQRVLQAACVVPVAEGMVVKTDSERVRTGRKVILELLASTVDLDDAPEIQAHLHSAGAEVNRFAGGVARQDQFTVIEDNPFYIRDYSQCVMCWRCIQVCADDVQHTYALTWGKRGINSYVATFFGEDMPDTTCVFCGNCVGVCPTGALKGLVEWKLSME